MRMMLPMSAPSFQGGGQGTYGAMRSNDMTMEFDGQVAIVTGAASGIGLGIAQAFHRAGASVVLGDVRQDALDQVQGSFPDQARLAFVPVDVRDQASVAH